MVFLGNPEMSEDVLLRMMRQGKLVHHLTPKANCDAVDGGDDEDERDDGKDEGEDAVVDDEEMEMRRQRKMMQMSDVLIPESLDVPDDKEDDDAPVSIERNDSR